MPYDKLPPNTILLHDRAKATLIDNIPLADNGALPGHFVEKFVNSGVVSWRRVSSATNIPSKHILLEDDLNNLNIDTTPLNAYVACLAIGMTVYALVPSGADITNADYLQQNGDGRLKEATAITAAANVAHYRALETIGPVTVQTRLRVEVVQ